MQYNGNNEECCMDVVWRKIEDEVVLIMTKMKLKGRKSHDG